jgi:hypothetical protein
MPLRLTVGLQRKLGQPNYGSLAASCAVELELAAGLLERDPAGFLAQVEDAFVACSQAVQAELVRQDVRRAAPSPAETATTPEDDEAPATVPCRSAPKPDRWATSSQIRALYAISKRQRFDLAAELERCCGRSHPEELTLQQASALIQEFSRLPSTGEPSSAATVA